MLSCHPDSAVARTHGHGLHQPSVVQMEHTYEMLRFLAINTLLVIRQMDSPGSCAERVLHRPDGLVRPPST